MPTGTYTKTDWTTSTPITAKAMNHMETQYEEAKHLIDNHDHDSRYYKKSESDTKFFHTGHMGAGSGADADMLDGQHLSNIMNASLPVGAILIWSGTDANVPQGWAICNGQIANGMQTPDLRDRFVIGAGGALSKGATGGAANVTPTATLAAGDHTLTVSEIPAHTHSYSDTYVTSSAGRFCVTSTSKAGSQANKTDGVTAATGSNAAHSHTGSIAFSGNSNIPPYYALFYIMKVS